MNWQATVERVDGVRGTRERTATMTTDPMMSRVLRGARFLDEHARGWRRKIRRRDLALESPYYRGPGSCGCVLAQLAPDGNYDTELRALDLSDHQARNLGFDDPVNDEWDALTQTWRRVLRENLR